MTGHTGAGKSTTIQFLGGSEMARDGNSGHIYPIKYAPGFEKFRVDEKYTESVTRYISAARLNLSDITGNLLGNKFKKSVFICDSPGFDDSAGAEVVMFMLHCIIHFLLFRLLFAFVCGLLLIYFFRMLQMDLEL